MNPTAKKTLSQISSFSNTYSLKGDAFLSSKSTENFLTGCYASLAQRLYLIPFS